MPSMSVVGALGDCGLLAAQQGQGQVDDLDPPASLPLGAVTAIEQALFNLGKPVRPSRARG